MEKARTSRSRISTKGGVIAFALLPPLLLAVIVVSLPAASQPAEHVLYSSEVKAGARTVEYCAIARADAAVPGTVMERQKSLEDVCRKLVKRLRMGVAYPSSPGSCAGYLKRTATICDEVGINLRRAAPR